MEYRDYSKVIILCLAIFALNLLLINNCPFHVDYIQYSASIDNFYSNKIIDDNVNGKYFYVYLMAVIITPLHLLNINTFISMIIITGLFQAIIIFLFYICTKSLLKTLLMSTTLTFLMFIGQPETIMLASIFMLLFFINRNKPYSEFFIMFASLIRLDFAVYYLFARKKTVILPLAFTFLQWLNGKFFLHSDIGINNKILIASLIFILSYGTYFILLLGAAKPKYKNIDCIIHIAIVIFLIVFLRFPSQKIFFFPIILSFILYDFNIKRMTKYVILIFMLINIVGSVVMQNYRADLCTSNIFYKYGTRHNSSIYFGIFEPYLNYYGLYENPPYEYEITQSCSNTDDYIIAEDWRNSQLFFRSFKFCIKEYS